MRNLKETVNILLQGVPAHIDLGQIRSGLLALQGVQGVHDVHVWSLEGETDVFTAHVVVEDELARSPQHITRLIKQELRRHHIEHSTVELESPDNCSGIECENGL